MAETRPHITVGHHDRYGVVAATSHDNHVAEHMLRRVGFERLSGSTLFGLTDPRRDPVRRGALAVQSLRAAQYSVSSDAAYDLQPHTRLSAGRGLPDRLEEPSASPASTVEEAVFAPVRTVGALSYTRSNGHPDATPSAQQRRAQAATAVSPARAGVPPTRHSAAIEYRPAPAAPQPVRTR